MRKVKVELSGFGKKIGDTTTTVLHKEVSCKCSTMSILGGLKSTVTSAAPVLTKMAGAAMLIHDGVTHLHDPVQKNAPWHHQILRNPYGEIVTGALLGADALKDVGRGIYNGFQACRNWYYTKPSKHSSDEEEVELMRNQNPGAEGEKGVQFTTFPPSETVVEIDEPPHRGAPIPGVQS